MTKIEVMEAEFKKDPKVSAGTICLALQKRWLKTSCEYRYEVEEFLRVRRAQYKKERDEYFIRKHAEEDARNTELWFNNLISKFEFFLECDFKKEGLRYCVNLPKQKEAQEINNVGNAFAQLGL